MGTTCRVPACLLWAYAKITLPITRQCFDGIDAAGCPFHMLRHHSPLLSSKLICTITAIITQNLGCGNYTCAIILVFWIDSFAGVLKYSVKHGNGSRESCIGKQCMWELSTFFMHFLVGAASPNPFGAWWNHAAVLFDFRTTVEHWWMDFCWTWTADWYTIKAATLPFEDHTASAWW